MSQSHRILLHLCMFLLFPYILYSMQITQSESDSLLRSLAQSKADTNKVKILLNLGEYQLYKPGEYKEDLDSALNYAKQAFALSQKLDNHQLETQSLNLFGSIYLELKNFNLAIEYQQKAIDLSYKHGDTQAEANSSMLLANVFRQKGDLEDARKQGQKSIELSVNNGHFQQAADAYLEMGKSYANYGEELGEKIKYFQLAKEAFGQAGNTKGQADLGKDLGDLYYLQGSSAQALLELKKALSLYQSIKHQPLQGVYDLLGTVSCDLSDFQEALKYGLLAVETAELVNDTSLQLCTIYNRVGLTYFYLNQFQKANVPLLLLNPCSLKLLN